MHLHVLSIVLLTRYLITGLTPKMDSLAGADTMENQNLTGTADVKAENSMILLLPLLALMQQLSDRL